MPIVHVVKMLEQPRATQDRTKETFCAKTLKVFLVQAITLEFSFSDIRYRVDITVGDKYFKSEIPTN